MHLKRLFPSIMLSSALLLVVLLLAGLGTRAEARGSVDCTPGPHSGTVTETERWCATNNPHIVDGLVTVLAGAILTVEKGVEVRFDASTGLDVAGALWAVGTVSEPVTFTANTPSPGRGYWYGISFLGTSDDSNCRLIHTTVEWGGKSHTLDVVRNGNVNIWDASPAVMSSTLSRGSRYGIDMTGSSPTLVNNLVYKNGEAGIVDRSSHTAPTLISNTFDHTGTAARVSPRSFIGTNRMSGNLINMIEVLGGTVAGDRTWSAQQGGAIAPLDWITVDAGAFLTIEQGTEVRFASGSGLYVSGTLSALGSPTRPVTMTAYGSSPTPGYWHGLVFGPDGGENSSVLENTLIEYGGWPMDICDQETSANLALCDASPSVRDTTVRYSGGHGVAARNSNSQLFGLELTENISSGLQTTGAGSALSILCSSIADNNEYGVQNLTPSSLTDARHNWWGDESGPQHSGNPGGTGDPVSDHVLYEPWLTLSACRPDLVVAESDWPEIAWVGEILTVGVQITNAAPIEARDVMLTHSVPSGAQVAGWSASQGNCSGTGPLVCVLGEIAANAVTDLELEIELGLDTLGPASVAAGVSTVDPELTLENNQVTAELVIVRRALYLPLISRSS